MSLKIRGSLISLSVSITSGVLQMWFSDVLWIGVGLGLVVFVVLFPWKQIIKPKDYLNILVKNMDYSHIGRQDGLATEPYVRPIIEFENKTDFNMHILSLQGTVDFGILNSISLQHELISVKTLSMKPHKLKRDIFQVAVTPYTAEKIMKAYEGSELHWVFHLGVRLSIGYSILHRTVYFETDLAPYKGIPKILNLDLLEELGELKSGV